MSKPRTRRRTWARWRSLAPLLVALVLLGAGAGQSEPVTWAFAKEDPDGDSVWIGTVSGPAAGDLETTLLAADQSRPVWLVSFQGVATAGERSFTAHVGGTLDTESGEVRMRGVVTEGWMLGSEVAWQGQMVDEATSRFEGRITVTPPSASP